MLKASLRNPQLYVILAGALYACLAYFLANAPMQDLPNHLVRSSIISDLLFDHGEIFGRMFILEPTFTPYLAGDLLLCELERWFGMLWACRLWLAAAVLSLPVAVHFVLRIHQVSRLTALAGALLAFYVATDWFFTMGFLNYKLATSVALFAYGWSVRALDASRLRPYIWYVVLVCVGYAMHLSALVFIIAIVGTSVGLKFLRGDASLWQAAKLLLPPFLILSAHFALQQHDATVYATLWGGWESKLRRLGSSFIRFDREPELALFVIFLSASLLPLAARRRQQGWARFDLLVVALTFVALFLVMPRESGGVADVDNRALPYALLFLILAGASVAGASQRLERAHFALAAVIACLNLVFLGAVMLPQDRDMGRYRQIARMIPRGASVLPVNTRYPIGRYQPFVHAGCYATQEAGALTPYMFTGNWTPAQSYFLYRKRPYNPSGYWYTDSEPGPAQTRYVDWGQVRQQYDYLLVTLPWDKTRIPISYRIVASNEVAALLSIGSP